MSFGKALKTRKEANAHVKKVNEGNGFDSAEVRKLSKKEFPLRKKLFHVGTFIDWLNFA